MPLKKIASDLVKFKHFSHRIEREKFYPEPGLEPGSLALRASALTTKLSRTDEYGFG